METLSEVSEVNYMSTRVGYCWSMIHSSAKIIEMVSCSCWDYCVSLVEDCGRARSGFPWLFTITVVMLNEIAGRKPLSLAQRRLQKMHAESVELCTQGTGSNKSDRKLSLISTCVSYHVPPECAHTHLHSQNNNKDFFKQFWFWKL